jgi:transposase-like protein
MRDVTYEDERMMADLLAAMRWPEGFHCERCDRTTGYYRHGKRPRTFICADCGASKSVTAGTLLHRTRLPLGYWYIAALFMASPGGISARALARWLKIHVETAWEMLHRLRHALPEDRLILTGVVEAWSYKLPRRFPPQTPKWARSGPPPSVVCATPEEGDASEVIAVATRGRVVDAIQARVEGELVVPEMRFLTVAQRIREPALLAKGVPRWEVPRRLFAADEERKLRPEETGFRCSLRPGESRRAITAHSAAQRHVGRRHGAVSDKWVAAYVREYVARTRSRGGVALQHGLLAHALGGERLTFPQVRARAPVPCPSRGAPTAAAVRS